MKKENLIRANEIIKQIEAIESDIKLFKDKRSRVRGYVSGELYSLPSRDQQTHNYGFIPNEYIKAMLLSCLVIEKDKLEQEFLTL